MKFKSPSLLFILKLSTCFIFLGRGYQHIFWDAPYRSLLWDQDLLELLINRIFGLDWNDYVTNLSIDSGIQNVIKATGFLYIFCACLSLFISNYSKKWIRIILWIGAINLVVLSLLLTKEKFYHLAMFFEHAIQFGTPFTLLYVSKHKLTYKITQFLKWIVALTFLCHGVYATGFVYPLPASFVTMTINILQISEANAIMFLKIAGILDFIIAIGIFIPKLAKSALIYAAIWGFLTALARITEGLGYEISLNTFHQYLYTTIYRLPHGIIPALLYYIVSRKTINA